MAFLDNSGNIILDAVLTDYGRKMLARADGTFRIVKFALSDEEIDYGTYKPLAPDGEEDLEIMQTPILEAFTNNTSMMHSYLQTYTNNETLMYLPILKLNTLMTNTNINSTFNSYLVAVDKNTACALGNTASPPPVPAGWNAVDNGIWYGYDPKALTTHCRIDQGIDNTFLAPQDGFPDTQMYENQYLLEMDSRFGGIVDKLGTTKADYSFVDDDGIVMYYFSKNANPLFVTDIKSVGTLSTDSQVIAGPRGSKFEFQIRTTQRLQNNNSLFEKLGGEFDARSPSGAAPVTCWYIDSIVRVTGLKTGYSIDVPIRYVKAQNQGYDCQQSTP
jgi:hypothetical protein